MESDFVEADLDTAFSLLTAAEMHSVSEDPADALRAIDEAENAISDGERRLQSLTASERDRLRGRVERMRALIEEIRLKLKSNTPPGS